MEGGFIEFGSEEVDLFDIGFDGVVEGLGQWVWSWRHVGGCGAHGRVARGACWSIDRVVLVFLGGRSV